MLSAALVLLAFLCGVCAGRLSLIVTDPDRAIREAEADEERWVG